MKRTMNMLQGPMWRKLILFALPIAATSILQQLFNSADVAVVGSFAGKDALAAVGANVANVGIFVNFLVGCSIGPNVVLARLIGMRREEEGKTAVGAAITLAALMGMAALILGELLTVPLLRWTGTPEGVIPEAAVYFRIYLLGVPFMTIYNFGAALIRSTGDTTRPLFCLIFSGVINVLLNLLFVIVFQMGVAGVALATLIANVISCCIILRILLKEENILHLDVKMLKPDFPYMWKILREGLPAGLQSMVFSLSNIFVQTGINSFGADAIAGSSAALNFEYFCYGMSSAFAQAAVTFTSQNFGAGQIQRCRRVFWIAMWEGIVFTTTLSMVFLLGENELIRIYSTDPNVMDYAFIRLERVMALEAMTVLYEVTSGVMRGIGHALIPSLLTVIGTVGFRMLWIVTVFREHQTFSSLLTVYPVSWAITTVLVVSAYIIILTRLRKGRRPNYD